MAYTFDSEFGRLVKPGAYPSVKVQASVSGLAANGIVAIIGEADGGAPGASETFEDNFFGPDQLAAVQSKYVTGPIVNAFRALVAPANDPNIVGSVTRVYIYKTNASLKASSNLINQGLGQLGTLEDLNYGRNGNLIYWKSLVSQAESEPTTGAFSYVPSPSAAAGKLRVNGGASQSFAIPAKTSPADLAATLDTLTGLLCQGGVDRSILSGLAGINIVVSAAGDTATFTLTVGSVFPSTPQVGDTLLVAALGDYGAVADSVYGGAGNENRGAYIVTAVSNTLTSAYIVARKIRNDTATPLVNPVAVGATPVSLNEDDIFVFSSMTISDATGDDRDVLAGLAGVNASVTALGSDITFALATGSFAATPQVGDLLRIPSGSAFEGAGFENIGDYEITSASSGSFVASRLSNGSPVSVALTPIVAASDISVMRPAKAGLGKSLEIQDNAGTDNLSLLFRQLGIATAVTWISSGSNPYAITSAAELVNQLSINRQSDNIQETFVAGGEIALKVGYLGTTATLTVGATTITTTVVGGSGANLSLTKSDFPTLSDLANYIAAQTGYAAAVGNTLLGQTSPDDLDLGTYGICSDTSASLMPGRIKRDLADLDEELDGSILVSFDPETTASGLLDATSQFAYLAGGAKGATTPASVLAGFSACESVAVNFVVPLFSRDASEDIADGLTDSGSTYTIDSVNAAAKSHVLAMSQVKRRKNRQAFLSRRGTFIQAKNAAQDMASYRVSMCFQDAKAGAADGSVQQFQPWYSACLAAGTQAAGFYRSIMKKFINASGMLQASGDFADNNDSQVEDALLSGLLPAERVATGGLRWISDQTTYGLDTNFVYNSVQAVYAADVVALSLAERMETAFVGQTLGDVSAAAALGFIQAVMSEYLRLKLIGPSDDAPAGYKNVVVKIQGGVMLVSMEIKLATAIYFIPISFTVSQISQTATL